MAKKRLHDVEIWSQDWFLEMPTEYKMLWMWVKDKCDHAGIWKPNCKIFERTNELRVDLNKALDTFNSEKERIVLTQKGNWWLKDFFVFQYGTTFNISNKVHNSIYSIYNQENISLGSIRGLIEVKLGSFSGLIEDYLRVKDKDKDKDKDNRGLKEGAETIKGGNGAVRGQVEVEVTSESDFEF